MKRLVPVSFAAILTLALVLPALAEIPTSPPAQPTITSDEEAKLLDGKIVIRTDVDGEEGKVLGLIENGVTPMTLRHDGLAVFVLDQLSGPSEVIRPEAPRPPSQVHSRKWFIAQPSEPAIDPLEECVPSACVALEDIVEHEEGGVFFLFLEGNGAV